MTKPYYYAGDDGSHNWEWIWDNFRFMIYYDPNEDDKWTWICVSHKECGEVSEYGDIPLDMRILMEVEAD